MKSIKKILLLLAAAVFLLALAACGGQAEEGLTLYLKFDEKEGVSAVDSSGTNSDGKIEYYLNTALYKSPESPRRRRGVKGTALWFDGWSTYLTYDDYTLPESFTLSVWVAPRSWEYPDNQITAIAGKYNRNAKEGFLLGTYNYGSWCFSFGTGDKWVTLDAGSDRLERFEWTHIAAVFDAETGTASILKNGDVVNSVSLGAGVKIKQTMESLTVGKNTFGRIENGYQTGLFCGLMDEFKIYDSALDRQAVYNEFRSGCDQDGNLPLCEYDDIGHEAELLRDDKYLPQYHIAPAAGWMNEPIAPFLYKGVYHMFFQSTASGPYWRYTQWGHWVSDDKVNWREVKPILFPEPDGFADHHVFSGNAMLDSRGTPYIFYTGVNFNLRNLNRISYAVPADLSDPYLTEWVRSDEPLFEQPADCSFVDFRDPYIYSEDGYAFMMIGTSSAVNNFRDGNPRVVCYRASLDDLTDWTYLGVSYEARYAKYPYLGYDWELPVFMRVKSDDGMWEKYCLMASPKPDGEVGLIANVYYWLGDFDTETGKFTPEDELPMRLDLANNQVLVVTNLAVNGENTLYGLMNGGQTAAQVKASGWTNYVTLGKVLTLDAQTGRLKVKFDPIYEGLHDKKLTELGAMSIEQANAALSATGDMLHIVAEFDVSDCTSAGIEFRKSGLNEFYQQEVTSFRYLSDGTAILDTTQSGIGSENGTEDRGKIDAGDTLKVEIYLDRSSVEIIINDGYCFTHSVFPTLSDALGIELTGDARLNALTVYSMKGTR